MQCFEILSLLLKPCTLKTVFLIRTAKFFATTDTDVARHQAADVEAGTQEEHLDGVAQRNQEEQRGNGVGGGRGRPQAEREENHKPAAAPEARQVHQEPFGFEGGCFRSGTVATRFACLYVLKPTQLIYFEKLRLIKLIFLSSTTI